MIPALQITRHPAFPGKASWLLTALVVGGALVGGLLAAQQPLLALAGVVVLGLSLAVMAQPEIATLAVIFTLYANLAAVAVRFHGLPFIIGAAFPLLLAIPFVTYVVFQRQKLVFQPAFPFIVLFLLVQLLGTLFADDIATASRNLLESLLEGALIYFLVTNVVRTPTTLRHIIWVLLIAGLVMTTIPIYQQVTDSFDSTFGGFGQFSERAFDTGVETIQGTVGQFRSAGPIGEKNRFAQVLLMLIPLGFFQFRAERNKLLQMLAVVATTGSAIGIALTFSRGAAVAFALMFLLMMLMRLIRPAHLIACALGVTLLLAAFPQYTMRIVSIQAVSELAPGGSTSGVDGAIIGRVTEMLAAVWIWADHPIVGVGPGMVRYYTQEYGNALDLRILDSNRQTHSLYLDIAANHGTLGLLTFTAFLFVTLRDLYRTRQKWLNERPELAHMATGFMFALIAYLATGIFLHLSYIRYFWLILALAGCASYVATEKKEIRR